LVWNGTQRSQSQDRLQDFSRDRSSLAEAAAWLIGRSGAGCWHAQTSFAKPWPSCGCAGVRDPDFAAKATVILDLYQGYYQGKRLRPGDRIISVVIRDSFEAVGCGGCGAVDLVGVSVTWRMISEH
jgi:hypothetical protein